MDYAKYSQRDWRWRWKRLGNSWSTIGGYGCFLTSLSMMVGKRPDEVNEILKKAGAFNKDLIISEKAAMALNSKYTGKEYDIDKPPSWSPSIKEVDMSPAKGKQQHFCLRVIENGIRYIIDPWTGQRQRITFYPFVSYRCFRNKSP